MERGDDTSSGPSFILVFRSQAFCPGGFAPPPLWVAPIKSNLSGKSRLDPTVLAVEAETRRRDAALAKLLAAMQVGAWIEKYSDACKPQRRFFRIDRQGTELCWGKFDFSLNRSELLATVESIVYGPGNERFGSYDYKNGRPDLCFSLLLESRSIDLECSNEQQVRTLVRLRLGVVWSEGFLTRVASPS